MAEEAPRFVNEEGFEGCDCFWAVDVRIGPVQDVESSGSISSGYRSIPSKSKHWNRDSVRVSFSLSKTCSYWPRAPTSLI